MNKQNAIKVKAGKLEPKPNDTVSEINTYPVPEDWEARKKMAEERLRTAQTMKGIFKDCKYTVNEEDVYHQ